MSGAGPIVSELVATFDYYAAGYGATAGTLAYCPPKLDAEGWLSGRRSARGGALHVKHGLVVKVVCAEFIGVDIITRSLLLRKQSIDLRFKVIYY